ncbi:MAG: LA2681 family HEPN domain-containing protein [Eubacteriales bacterium]
MKLDLANITDYIFRQPVLNFEKTMNNDQFKEIDGLINSGNFYEANIKNEILLQSAIEEKDEAKKAIFLFNIAGFFVDIGHLLKENSISQKGLDLLEENRNIILQVVPKSEYFYDLANAKSNLTANISGENINFDNIEELIEVKNLYWKAFKENQTENDINLKLRVNLANSLKQQFRISEALRYYDEVLNDDNEIFQANVNRSHALKILNAISDTYSAKLFKEIIYGYSEACRSPNIPPQFVEHYELRKTETIKILKSFGFSDERKLDDEETDAEFQILSEYRKFCIMRKLTLSEHALYCNCIGAARDNLTIPLTNKQIGGDFVPKMEAILNRVKSEFSLARLSYYEYINCSTDTTDLDFENCYTDLMNGEVLGVSIEKLRTSFRICFGILDKIALAICELYIIETEGDIYFQNFWKLDFKNNRKKFDSIKNPGLLALYSIATDLNVHKKGEWACFKDWRNALEHGMLFIYKDRESFRDPYNSLEFLNSPVPVMVELNDFLDFIVELLQLTRSAIFSFVFCVRDYANEKNKTGMVTTLNRVNYDRNIIL